jgi:hypothetical protein
VNTPQRAGLVDHVAFGLVLVVTMIAFALIIGYRWRRGATLLGGALLLAAGLRAVLSDQRAGLLAIRGRSTDVLAYTAFGLALVAVAATID